MIGLNQTELARLCGCSSRTIQAVELLHLPLSGKLATRISKATGVSPEWLMDGNCEVPPQKAAHFIAPAYSDIWNRREQTDKAYNADSFASYRAQVEAPVIPRHDGERAMPESPSTEALAQRRKITDVQDKLLLQLCKQLLEDTADHEQALVLRWKLKKDLLTKYERYGVSIERSDDQDR